MYDEVLRLENLYYAENTKKTRSVQLRRYENFCALYGFTTFPLESMCMKKYIAFLGKDLCFSSIQQYVSAIIVLSKAMGYPIETRESLGITWILGGVKRWKGDVTESSKCIFPEDLYKIKDCLNLRVLEDIVFWLCCMIMFRTLLRGSNVLDTGMGLMFDDVQLEDWGVLFLVRRTKTIQFKQRILKIPVSKLEGHPLCFIPYLEILCKYGGTGPGLPLLGWLKGGKFCSAKYDWFVKKLHGICIKLKWEGKFGTHSFRHGGATTMSLVGMDLPGISKRGDWKSLCVLKYLNRPLLSLIKEEKLWCKKIMDMII